MTAQVIKIDDNTIHIINENGRINEYKLDFLLYQVNAIKAQRDAEIAEVDELLALCNSVGVVEQKPEEQIMEEVVEEIKSVIEEQPITESILTKIIKAITSFFK
jgi:hypothetical protein